MVATLPLSDNDGIRIYLETEFSAIVRLGVLRAYVGGTGVPFYINDGPIASYPKEPALVGTQWLYINVDDAEIPIALAKLLAYVDDTDQSLAPLPPALASFPGYPDLTGDEIVMIFQREDWVPVHLRDLKDYLIPDLGMFVRISSTGVIRTAAVEEIRTYA